MIGSNAVAYLRGKVVQDGDADGRVEHTRAEREPHAVARQNLSLEGGRTHHITSRTIHNKNLEVHMGMETKAAAIRLL